MAPTVYHLAVSQSDRVVWILEELGIDYDFKRFEREADNSAPEEYKKLSPTHTAPVISDIYNGSEIRLSETGAILQYLEDVYGKGKFSVKVGEDGYADYLFWLHFANSSLMFSMWTKRLMATVPKEFDKNGSYIVVDRLEVYYPLIEKHLAKNKYFAGDKFTIADINMFFPLTTMRAFVEIDYSPYPHIKEYVKRLSQRPTWQKAVKKADPGFEIPLE